MKTGPKGLALIKLKEEFRARAYVCPANHLTIGYGHVIQPHEKQMAKLVLTEPAAALLLANDLKRYEHAVTQAVKVPLSQNQFDALVAICYNIGVNGFAGSSLVKCLNQRLAEPQVRTAWSAWCKMDGTRNKKDDDKDGLVDEPGEKQVAAGLVTRRREEANLFYQ
jgi:lysozyme